MFRQLHTAALSMALTVICVVEVTAEPAPFMMRAVVNDRVIEGQPLAWASEQILLLGRDGALYDFNPADAKNSKKTAKAYTGYTSGEMQALVRTEFDRRWDISISTHFVVVRPRGRGTDWARRLESLYSGFNHYMSVRGFRLSEPPTPLVAIVFRNRDEYYQYAADHGTTLGEGTLGHYDGQSNRVYLYDIAEDDESADWSSNAETIIHEATHQTAYNTGIHHRFAEQPRWVVEGLAMMFEAPGVWSAASFHAQADRINRYRLEYFRDGADTREEDWIGTLVASDRPFERTPFDAYAEAWVLSFYLCETRPQEYSAYLARVANRKLFSQYSPADRVADFTSAFGHDLRLLHAQVLRFVEKLP
jgi:hypothetical protein